MFNFTEIQPEILTIPRRNPVNYEPPKFTIKEIEPEIIPMPSLTIGAHDLQENKMLNAQGAYQAYKEEMLRPRILSFMGEPPAMTEGFKKWQYPNIPPKDVAVTSVDFGVGVLKNVGRAAKNFIKGGVPNTLIETQTSNWKKLQEQNPDLFNTGILRRSQKPHGAKGVIPDDVHTAQAKWQNYGQGDDIPVNVLYERINSGSYKGDYVDKKGFLIKNADGDILRDTYNESTLEWEVPTISNKDLKDNLLNTFSTKEGKEYLNEVIKALPKNPDGSITAYRIGVIGDGPQSYTLSEGMAKTFSNQGTDILPAGTPGLPTKGYKDFGVLPVTVVKIDPKGIVAWSPYDAEILVELKYAKTKF